MEGKFYMRLKKLKNKAGFSLVEVMVGFVLLVVAIIPIFEMVSIHYKQTADAGKEIIAQNLAQKKMEEWKSKKQVEPNGNFSEAGVEQYVYEIDTGDNPNDNTYTIIIKYQDQNKPIASLTGEIPTQ